MLARIVLLCACLAPFLGGVLCQTTTGSTTVQTAVPIVTSTVRPSPDPIVQTRLIPEGGSGKLQCFTEEHPLPALSHLLYSWTYHGLPHIEHGYFDQVSGTLFINEAKVKSSGTYECRWSGTGPKGDVSGVHSHRLIVYKVPDVEFEVTSPHFVEKCVDSVDSWAMQNYREKLCKGSRKDCPYDVSYQCTQNDKGRPTVKGRKATLDVKVKIRLPPDYNPPICDADCIRDNMAMVLISQKEQMLVSWNEIFFDDPEASKWYNEAPGSLQEDIEASCADGFLPYKASVCAPCEPGTSWDAETKTCVRCPFNTYQDVAGTMQCKPCPQGKKTYIEGVTSITKCYMAMHGNGGIFATDGKQKKIRDDSKQVDRKMDGKAMLIASAIGVFVTLLFIVLALLILVCLIRKNERRQNKLLRIRQLTEADRFDRFLDEKKISSEKIVDTEKLKNTLREYGLMKDNPSPDLEAGGSQWP